MSKNIKKTQDKVQSLTFENTQKINQKISSTAMETSSSNIIQNSTGSDETRTSKNKQEIIILNENNETELISFVSDEILESIQLEDSTVEIVGFIDEIEGPKIVGKAQHYRLLKFILNNNSRHRVQVVAWNAEIERIEHYLQPNGIIHIDGAKAKKIKIPEFNHGTLAYELVIRSNTIINCLGSFDLKKIINAIQPQLIDFPDICENLNSCILVRGFIKTNFNTVSNNYKTYGSGSITDGIYKLEIQITDYEHNKYFEKGKEVEIKGYVKMINDVFYLDVDKMCDVKLIKEGQTMSFNERLKGTKSIMKRTINDNATLPSKITRI